MVNIVTSDTPSKGTTLSEETREDLKAKAKADAFLFEENLYNRLVLIEKAKQNRLDKGLKANKITTDEVLWVLEDWLDNGRGVLTRSMRLLYENSTNLKNKEVDWVKGILRSKYFYEEFSAAITKSTHPKLTMLKDSTRFDIKNISPRLEFSRRVKMLGNDLDAEELIMDLQQQLEEKSAEVAMLKEQVEESSDWKTKATKLLSEGYKIKEVASMVGKSESTMKKFSAKLVK